jgi:hypothetical protein
MVKISDLGTQNNLKFGPYENVGGYPDEYPI